jgi:chemotaxis protein CheD
MERPVQPREHGAAPEWELVYLLPGKLYASDRPAAITTILGSCVAVCLWDPIRGVGGMNHYLLPHQIGLEPGSGRFGDVAVKLLLEKVLDLGALKRNLQAKLFGGACVLNAMRSRQDKTHLGAKNVDVARKLLSEAGIPVILEEVGGRAGRKLVFHPVDGSAWVKLLLGGGSEF